MKMFKLSEAPSIPPREYLIEGLIYKGEISLLYGPSGSGKSAIIEDMFTRAAAGLAVPSLYNFDPADGIDFVQLAMTISTTDSSDDQEAFAQDPNDWAEGLYVADRKARGEDV